MTSVSSPSSEGSWEVSASEQGMTLLRFLQARIESSRSAKSLKKDIESKGCFVNGQLERFAARPLWKGDKVLWRQSTIAALPSPSIIYEDESFLALDKPPGLVCEPSAIAGYLPRHSTLLLVHRLDRDTSGLLLLAKSRYAEEGLRAQFHQRVIVKSYIAISSDSPSLSEGTICNYMLAKGRYCGQTFWGCSDVQVKGSLYAETSWRTLAKASKFAILECHPKTGRTHQIRVHLASLGCPIAGDSQYGKDDSLTMAPRCLLHAWKLSLKHPATGAPMQLLAPPPNDWKASWDRLSKGLPFNE